MRGRTSACAAETHVPDARSTVVSPSSTERTMPGEYADVGSTTHTRLPATDAIAE